MEDKVQPVAGLPPVGDPEATAVRRRNVKSHEAILHATRELVGESGYGSLTIEGIAARAGVGKSTIYRWWRSKGELVAEALAEILEARPIPDSGDTRQDLTAIVHQAMVLYEEETGARAIIVGLVSDMHHNPELAEALLERLIRPRRAGNREVVKHAMARGDLPADTDVELLIDVLVAPIAYRALITDAPITDGLATQLVDRLLGPTSGSGPDGGEYRRKGRLMKLSRILAALVGALIALVAVGLVIGGGALVWAHSTERDADGFLTSPTYDLETRPCPHLGGCHPGSPSRRLATRWTGRGTADRRTDRRQRVRGNRPDVRGRRVLACRQA